ncbi:MAG: NAD(P)/FAD-dependent oxidoreductase, partial [Acidobacteria bacterium]
MRHVIIGAGPAGVAAAETLRKADHDAEITLLGGETEPPYARMAIPYLLKGDIGEAGTHIRKDPGHYARLRIGLLHARAQAVDTNTRLVFLGDGRSLPYDRLLVATGSRPSRERIPGIDLPGVRTCWTLEDARAILAAARPGTRVVQMGAGFVGCIIMEGLLARGVDLTVLVRSGYMVRRMMNPTASGLIRRWCEGKGVRILTRTQPKGLKANGGALEVDLGDGRLLPADIYLSAVGVDPNLDFLAGSGLDIAQGILVDATLQSSVRGVYAAGDVAESTDCLTGKRQLNAIQPNAVEQGRIAALNMAGRPA